MWQNKVLIISSQGGGVGQKTGGWQPGRQASEQAGTAREEELPT